MTLEAHLRGYFARDFMNDEKRMPHVAIENGLQGVTGGVLTLQTVWQNVVSQSGDIVLEAPAAFALAQQIDFLSSQGNNHRTMLTRHAGWRHFYQVGPRPLWFRNADGNEGPRAGQESVACSACGVCLPINCIEVDHQRPQAGSSAHAICKVFRTVGLTEGAPVGHKGQQLIAQHRNPMRQLAPKNPAGRPIAQPRRLTPLRPTTEKARRYTLTPQGNAILSLFAEFGDLRHLELVCMNHFANLQPMCPACNKVKSDRATINDAGILEERERG